MKMSTLILNVMVYTYLMKSTFELEVLHSMQFDATESHSMWTEWDEGAPMHLSWEEDSMNILYRKTHQAYCYYPFCKVMDTFLLFT